MDKEFIENPVEAYEKLKQEVDILKAKNRELKAVHSTNVALSDKLFKYKAENDSLKSELMQTNCYLDADKEIIDKFKADNKRLKQTLDEIKEIAENVIKNVSERCIETTPMYGVHKQILQKISEVQNDR